MEQIEFYDISKLVEELKKGNAISYAKASHWNNSPLYAATRNGWFIQYHPVAHFDINYFLRQNGDELDEMQGLYIRKGDEYKPVPWERVVFTGGRYGELLILDENQTYEWLSSNGWYSSYVSPFTGSQYVLTYTYGRTSIYPGKVAREVKATVHGLAKITRHQRVIIIEHIEQAKGKFLISRNHDWIVEKGDGYKSVVPTDLDIAEHIELSNKFKYTGIEEIKDYLYKVGKIEKLNVYARIRISDPRDQEVIYIFIRKPKCYVIIDEMRLVEL